MKSCLIREPQRSFMAPLFIAICCVSTTALAAEVSNSEVVSAPVASEANELSTELQSEIVIPPGRPDWVERLPIRNQPIDETVVCSEPFASREACRTALAENIRAAIDDYIAEQTGSTYAATVLTFDHAEKLQARLVRPENYYEEEIISPSVGPMHQIHARVQFDEAFRKEIADRWLQVRAAARLGQVGLGFVTVLGLLATIAGFFRADNATRGYYTGRLQMIAAGAILGLIVLGAFVARLIPWI